MHLTWLVLLALMSAQEYPTYELTQETSSQYERSGILELKTSGQAPFGPSLPRLSFNAYYETNTILHVRITDAEAERWDPDNYPILMEGRSPMYQLEVRQMPFSFNVVRNGMSLFDTQGPGGAASLYFADLYLEIGTSTPSDPNVYGLGERVTSFRLPTDNTRFTIWALAQDCIYDTGKEERGRNMYGHHPFYMELRDGLAHGVYFHNINAMDAVFTDSRLTFKTVGGMMDFYFFMGPTPQAVVQQYLSVIGAPMLPPYWSLGFHQCRWGYSSLSKLQEVVRNYERFDLPLDVLWSDIDYMDSFKDFTLDTNRYPAEGFKELMEELHAAGRHYVPIVDAGIKVEEGYFAYEDGLDMGVFITRRANTTTPFEGQVWPGKSVFVDWFHPNSYDYWARMLATMQEVVPFDGIWIDMNEASSFCDGECPGFYNDTEEQMTLPYVPGNHSLEDQLLPLLAQQYEGPLHTIFNTHGTFGTMETEATHNYLAETFNERPFVLSRSSRAGHGQWGFHWLGDNWSLWDQMRDSIAGVFNFQLFGVGLVGADVCGFHNDTTDELCSRWLQLGGFYPFMRNHNDIGWKSQELYALGPEVMKRGKDAIHLRYSLILYFYTQLHLYSDPSREDSAPLFRPLLFDFPELPETYTNQEQIMVGPALLFNPVLYPGLTEVSAFVPVSEIWYDYFTGQRIPSEPQQVFSADLDHISLLLRGGTAIPTQNPTDAVTVVSMRTRPIDIKVALNSDGKAAGNFILDDGVSLNTIQEEAYSEYKIKAKCVEKRCVVSVWQVTFGYKSSTDYLMLGKVEIYGLQAPVRSARIKTKALSVTARGDVLQVDVQKPLGRTVTVELLLA